LRKGGKPSQTTDAPAAQDFGLDRDTIHRWRRRLKAPGKFTEALEAAHERCVKVCEARQGRTTAYRTNAEPDSRPDAHYATVVGD